MTEFNSNFKPRLQEISNILAKSSENLTSDALLDLFLALYLDCKSAPAQNEFISAFLSKYEKLDPHLRRLRVNPQDFEVIKTLAIGAIGTVCLVRGKVDNHIYAMKILKKVDLLTKREAAFFMEERNALVDSNKSQWITSLYAAFQDDQNLYLVMEFAPGGSLRGLIESRESMSEDEARFYAAEILLSLDDLHSLGYIHRDVKPENCLIDQDGHIKLADFGSCTKADENNKITSADTVGTPDYISPEILRAHEGMVSYGVECDWWSLGIIIFELLYDEVPFYSESLLATYAMIMNHEENFSIPDEPKVSEEALDLIAKWVKFKCPIQSELNVADRLICKKEIRLGFDQIKIHPWFKNIDWESIRNSRPPFVPELTGLDDTRYFDDEDNEMKKTMSKCIPASKTFSGHNLPFVGYTYIHDLESRINWNTLNAPAADEVQEMSTTLANMNKKLLEKQQEIDSLRKDVSRSNAQFKSESIQKAALQLKLRESQTSPRSETEISVMLKQTDEVRKDLEGQITILKSQLVSEKSKLNEADIKFHDVLSSKNLLEQEVQELEKRLGQESEKQMSTSLSMSGMSRSLENQQQKQDELESIVNIYLKENADLENEVKYLNEKLEGTKKSFEEITSTCGSFQKENAKLKIELESLIVQLENVVSERDALSKEARKVGSFERLEIAGLQDQLQNMTQCRDQIASQVSSLAKEKVVLDVEMTGLNSRLRQQVALLDESRSNVSTLEKQTSEMYQKIRMLESLNSRLERQVDSFKLDSENTTSQLLEERRFNHQSESRRLELEKNVILLSSELEAVRTRHDAALIELEEKKAMVENLEISMITERNSKIRFENELQNVQREILEWKQVNFILQDEVVQTKEKLALTHESLEDMQFKSKALRAEMDNTAYKNEEMSHQLESSQRHIESLEQQIQELKSGQIVNEVVGRQRAGSLVSFESDTDLSAAPPKDLPKNTDKKNKNQMHLKLLVKMANIGRQKQRREEQDLAMRKLDEVEEGVSGNYIRRGSSISSSDRLSSPSQVPSKLPKSVDFESNGLSGWIKIPKTGKVRKGWKEQFALVRDFKLYLFDKDKDFDQSTGHVIADFRCEVFYIRTVTQNELIHVKGREIDYIIKIQTANVLKPIEDSTQPVSKEGVDQRLRELRNKIQNTVDVCSGLEKMQAAPSAAIRQEVSQQLQAEKLHLKKLQDELSTLESSAVSTEPNLLERKMSSQTLVDYTDDEVRNLAEKLELELLGNKKIRDEFAKLAEKRGRNSPMKNGSETSVLDAESNFHRLEDEILGLKSGDAERIRVIMTKYNVSSKVSKVKGHSFKYKTNFYQVKDCSYCHQAIWNGNAHECSECKIACHKPCIYLVEHSCKYSMTIKENEPIFIMTKDNSERNRWLAGLDYYRKECMKWMTLPSASPASQYGSTTPMKRVKGDARPLHSPLKIQTKNKDNSPALS